MFLLLGGCSTDSCSPNLQPNDALPYQSCSFDDDCTTDSLNCNGCATPVAIAKDKQQAFEALKGCWPVPAGDDSDCTSPGVTPGGPSACTVPSCSRGHCILGASPLCATATTGTTGFVTTGFTNGFTSTGTFSSSTFSNTTGGVLPICGICTDDSQCRSNFCNELHGYPGFCDVDDFCSGSACAPNGCNTLTGECVCPATTSSTTGSGTTGSSTGSTGSTGLTGSTGSTGSTNSSAIASASSGSGSSANSSGGVSGSSTGGSTAGSTGGSTNSSSVGSSGGSTGQADAGSPDGGGT